MVGAFFVVDSAFDLRRRLFRRRFCLKTRIGSSPDAWRKPAGIDRHVVHLHVVAVAKLVQREGLQHGRMPAHRVLRLVDRFLGHLQREHRLLGDALGHLQRVVGKLGAGLRVGTLDDPGAWRPDAVIFTESKMPWVTLPDGIPAFETVYNQFELLPRERVARLETMIERRKAGEG